MGGPAGGVGGPAGGLGGAEGGVGGPAGGLGGAEGGVGGPAGGVGGASRIGLSARTGASPVLLVEEVNPVDRSSKSVLIRVSPPSEFSAE